MSREFGSDVGGYFHTKVANAAEDAEGGRLPTTLAWGKVLRAMVDVAYAIASAEEGDSGEDFAIKESLDAVRGVKAALCDVEAAISSHRSVAKDEVVETLIRLLPEPVLVEPTKITMRVPRMSDDKDPHFYARFRDALAERVRRWVYEKHIGDRGIFGWATTGSSWRSGDDFETHFFAPASSAWTQKQAVRDALVRGDVAEALRMIDGTTTETKA